MKQIKNGWLVFLVAAMVFLAVLGFNQTTVNAHGHHGGGGGGHHHGEHPHEHYRGGEHQHPSGYDSHYHHSHDDKGDHDHPCRSTQGSGTGTEGYRSDPFNEECLNHKGEWEPSQGD